jgi:protease I
MKTKSIVLTLFITLISLAQTRPLRSGSIFSQINSQQIPQGTPPKVQQPPVESSQLFQGKRVAILASHGVEESEIVFPYMYLSQRGAQVDILVPDWTPEGIVASRFLMPSLFVKATGTFSQGLQVKYDLLVLTGGAWNAQVVRSDDKALNLVRAQYQKGLPLAAICAGSSILINAGLTRGNKLTGSPVIKQDLINAGANYQNIPLVIDRKLVTSRSPDDLGYFVQGLKYLLLLK